MGSRYDPRDHIQQIEVAPQAEGVLDQREITVQSYQTTVPFDFDSLSSRIEKAWLAPSILLGLFQRTPLTGKDEIHVVLGLQGSLSVRAYDYDERRPIYYSWKDVVVETVAVQYVRDEHGLLRFTTFGGGMRIGEEKLHEFNEGFLKIPKDAVSKRRFDLDRLRDLCFGRFADRLYKLRFSNPSSLEYRSIDRTQFQSRKYIDPEAERLREIRADVQVKIEAFDSDIPARTTDLVAPVDVRFAIQGLSGALRLRFPKVQYSAQLKTVEEQVRIFYRLVDETVRSILDADYYARRRLSLAELEKNPQFPEFADTEPYREVLRNAETMAEFFSGLDLGAPKQEWLPHLRAIDELLANNELEPDVIACIGALADRAPDRLCACLRPARRTRVSTALASSRRTPCAEGSRYSMPVSTLGLSRRSSHGRSSTKKRYGTSTWRPTSCKWARCDGGSRTSSSTRFPQSCGSWSAFCMRGSIHRAVTAPLSSASTGGAWKRRRSCRRAMPESPRRCVSSLPPGYLAR